MAAAAVAAVATVLPTAAACLLATLSPACFIRAPFASRKPHALHMVIEFRHFGVADVPQTAHLRPESSTGAGPDERCLRGRAPLYGLVAMDMTRVGV